MRRADPRDRRTLALLVRRRRALRPGRRSSSRTRRIEVGDRTLIDDAGHVARARRARHASSGANGSGKTTLVETLAGEREPAAGKLRRGHNVKLGYLSQHSEVGGGADATLLVARAARDRALGGEDAGAARPLPVLRRGRRRSALADISGGEAPAAGAGAADALRRQPADPRRADQPPRPREPRGARGRAHRLRRLGAADLPRPGAARGGRQPHAW